MSKGFERNGKGEGEKKDGGERDFGGLEDAAAEDEGDDWFGEERDADGGREGEKEDALDGDLDVVAVGLFVILAGGGIDERECGGGDGDAKEADGDALEVSGVIECGKTSFEHGDTDDAVSGEVNLVGDEAEGARPH